MIRIDDIVKQNLCIGCGICAGYSSKITMEYCEKKGQYIPHYCNEISNKELNNAWEVCPGKGYKIIADAKMQFGDTTYTTDLGFFTGMFAARSLNPEILKNSSSGGIMSELSCYLINNKIVDYVMVTRFKYTTKGPIPETILTNSTNDILESQGSKYCPVEISDALKKITKMDNKVAVIGTPCQIAGIRMLQNKVPALKKNISLIISNFCGGFKDSRSMKKISERLKIEFSAVKYFRFRGDGQPGSMKIVDSIGNCGIVAYPKYNGFTGLPKHYRCQVCVDATGELADISCGDAWLDKYINDENVWSFIICRSDFGRKLVEKMAKEKLVVLAPANSKEISASQHINLKSKKVRKTSREKIYRIFGMKFPEFDGGYYCEETSSSIELKILLVRQLKNWFEQIGLYWPVYKFFKYNKYKKNKA